MRNRSLLSISRSSIFYRLGPVSFHSFFFSQELCYQTGWNQRAASCRSATKSLIIIIIILITLMIDPCTITSDYFLHLEDCVSNFDDWWCFSFANYRPYNTSYKNVWKPSNTNPTNHYSVQYKQWKDCIKGEKKYR